MCIRLSFVKLKMLLTYGNTWHRHTHYTASAWLTLRIKISYTHFTSTDHHLLAVSLSLSRICFNNCVWFYFCACFYQKECNEDCNFKELILENHYNTYASAKWTHSGGEMFVALNQKGLPVKGKKTKKEQKTAHFLPMAIT